jgi:hypothetical protein
MTHEHTRSDEVNGPEHDHTLPDADSIPVHDDPADSDAPPLAEDESLTVEQARRELGQAVD